MPCCISETKRRMIEVNIALDKPAKEITKDVNVSRRSVQRFSKNLRVHGSIAPPKVVSQGWPRTITPEMQDVHVISPSPVTCHRHDMLTESHFWITLLHVPQCTSISRFTTYGIPSVSKWMSNALSACSNA